MSTSTATLFNFFGSLSNTIVVVLANQVYYEHAIWLLIWCSLGTVIGLHVIKDLIEKTHKTSIVVFLLVVVLLIASFITISTDLNSEKWDITNPTANLQWGSYCQ